MRENASKNIILLFLFACVVFIVGADLIDWDNLWLQLVTNFACLGPFLILIFLMFLFSFILLRNQKKFDDKVNGGKLACPSCDRLYALSFNVIERGRAPARGNDPFLQMPSGRDQMVTRLASQYAFDVKGSSTLMVRVVDVCRHCRYESNPYDLAISVRKPGDLNARGYPSQYSIEQAWYRHHGAHRFWR